jgi:hypothetical protein
MTDTYVIHICGKEKKIVKRCKDELDVIQFITAVNKGSSYLKNESFESFEYNDEHDDNVYIVKEGNLIRVIKLQTLILTGYVYSSTYKIRNILNEYELVEGDTEKL